MKMYKKTYVKVEDLMIDDHLKVAGLLYRVNKIEKVGNQYMIHFYSTVNKKYTGLLSFRKNTLMKIWNQA